MSARHSHSQDRRRAFRPFAGVRAIGLKPLLLTFEDPALERAFQDEDHVRSMPMRRISVLLGMVGIGAFGVTDLAYFAPPTSYWLLALRYGLGWAGFVAVLALSYTRHARRMLSASLVALILWIGGCILAMIHVGRPLSYDYYVGLLMCYIFGYTLMNAPIAGASAAGLVLLLAYVMLSVLAFDPPLDHLGVSSLFMGACNGVCMIAGYALQFAKRRDFYLRQEVEARTDELAAAQRELVEQERLSVVGELAGAMAHELRNPLGVIVNAVYYLRATSTGDDPTTGEYLGIIGDEVHGSTRLVEALLHYADATPPSPRAALAPDLVQRVIEMSVPPHSEDGARFERVIALPEDLPPLWVDVDQVCVALANVVDNAYRAMPEGGVLTIRARVCPEGVELSVSDTGVGIAEEAIPHLFEPLYTTRTRGIGLGLAIADRWVAANGGRIEVRSQVGQGSTFAIILPAAPEGGSAATAPSLDGTAPC